MSYMHLFIWQRFKISGGGLSFYFLTRGAFGLSDRDEGYYIFQKNKIWIKL